jgi:hypothetical protein
VTGSPEDGAAGANEEGEEGRGGSRLLDALFMIGSSPWSRFAIRAAIPIVVVIVAAILIGAH